MACFVAMRMPLFEYTDFHQTDTHLYVFGYTSIDQRGKLLTIGRTEPYPLDVQCSSETFTMDEYQAELARLNEANSSNGGLQPVCKVPLCACASARLLACCAVRTVAPSACCAAACAQL